jgi:hypothetical protein
MLSKLIIFLANYKSISYDKNNIIKYVELLKYFRYDITENIIRHVFETYFLMLFVILLMIK